MNKSASLGNSLGPLSAGPMAPEDPADPDLLLVQALQIGEDHALEALMSRHHQGLFRFVYRQIPNEADALELTMEVFVRAYFGIGRFRPTARFTTWLYQIALNLCRDHLRSRAYQYSLQTVSLDGTGEENVSLNPACSGERQPDQKADHREEIVALEKVINELPDNLKNVLILTTLEDRSHAETAELLGVSLKAVGKRVYRARKLLVYKMTKLGF